MLRHICILLSLLLAVLCSAAPIRPLKIRQIQKNDFDFLSIHPNDHNFQEDWLCPYAYSPVLIPAGDVGLKSLLVNFTRLFDQQFKETQYGMCFDSYKYSNDMYLSLRTESGDLDESEK